MSQPARTAPVDGANLDLRSAPLRRSTYPLPPRLLFALTSEPTGQQDATSSATPRLHTDFIFDSHPPIPWASVVRRASGNTPPEVEKGANSQ